ncbi:hypothetical protein HQ550_03990, partial [bacterium]|nr:hypothetical protein [bacterium]
MKRTPIGEISICISWIIFFAGITLGLYFCYGKLFKLGTIIISGSIVLAVLLRLLANVNEFLFNLSKFNSSTNENISTLNKSIDKNSDNLITSIGEGTSAVNKNLLVIENSLSDLK